MTQEQLNNPLHGVTLEALLSQLVNHFGWEQLAERLPINCFMNEPTLKSSLTFLRRTTWAREKLEALYLDERANLAADTPSGEQADSAPRKILSRRLPVTSESTSPEEGAANPVSTPAVTLSDSGVPIAMVERPKRPRRTTREEGSARGDRDNRGNREGRGNRDGAGYARSANGDQPRRSGPRRDDRQDRAPGERGERSFKRQGDAGARGERPARDGRPARGEGRPARDGRPARGEGRPARDGRPARAAQGGATNMPWPHEADPVERERLMQQRYAERLNKGDRPDSAEGERPARKPRPKPAAYAGEAGYGDKPARKPRPKPTAAAGDAMQADKPARKPRPKPAAAAGDAMQGDKPARKPRAKPAVAAAESGAQPKSPWAQSGRQRKPRPADAE